MPAKVKTGIKLSYSASERKRKCKPHITSHVSCEVTPEQVS